MTQSLANIAIILGFILCIATGLILALRSKAETPDE